MEFPRILLSERLSKKIKAEFLKAKVSIAWKVMLQVSHEPPSTALNDYWFEETTLHTTNWTLMFHRNIIPLKSHPIF